MNYRELCVDSIDNTALLYVNENTNIILNDIPYTMTWWNSSVSSEMNNQPVVVVRMPDRNELVIEGLDKVEQLGIFNTYLLDKIRIHNLPHLKHITIQHSSYSYYGVYEVFSTQRELYIYDCPMLTSIAGFIQDYYQHVVISGKRIHEDQ